MAQQEKRIRDTRLIAGFLLLLVMYLVYSLKTTVNDITLHIPPETPNGYTMKVGEVPNPNVYIFSHYLFQTLNTWDKNGAEEAPVLYNTYRDYMTDNFKEYLLDVHDLRTRSGETKGRSRSVREAIQTGYDPSKVVKITNNKWVVKLDMLVVEKIGSTEIKRVTVRYPMVVLLDDTSPDRNPWGFKFAGYDSEPKKILIKGVS